MADKAWKATERRMARDVGTERIPVTGIDRHGADFANPRFAFQLKVRRMIPAWLSAWLCGICGSAELAGKIGVLVVKRPGERDEDAVVLMRWKDWLALHEHHQSD